MEGEKILNVDAAESRERNVAVVIPAHNEELTIGGTLASLPVAAGDAYVVDDGSHDRTSERAAVYTPNVLRLETNVGKAKATERVLNHYDILNRYEFVVFSDADTQLDNNYVLESLDAFDDDAVLVLGQVANRPKGAIAAFRAFEYSLWQAVYKNAQSAMKVIFVAPGCASMYRCSGLKQLSFDADTLAEDTDLTLQVHRGKVGGVRYAAKAVVYTQDPPTVAAYGRQVSRWYTGFWQNVKKHRVPLGRQKVDLELGYLTFEALFYPFALGLGILFSPFFFKLLLFAFVTEALVTAGFAAVVAVKEKRADLFGYCMFFPFFRILNTAIFISAFTSVVLLGRSGPGWATIPRYKFN
ncbi:MAG: glycosyltransferase [Terriglobia bacterium]